MLESIMAQKLNSTFNYDLDQLQLEIENEELLHCNPKLDAVRTKETIFNLDFKQKLSLLRFATTMGGANLTLDIR